MSAGRIGIGFPAAVRVGLLFGAAAVYLSLVGIVETTHRRAVVAGLISFGQATLLLMGVGAGYVAAPRAARAGFLSPAVDGAVAGAAGGLVLDLLIVLSHLLDLRAVFINASPALFTLLTFGRPPVPGVPLLLITGCLLGAAGGLFAGLPRSRRHPVVLALAAILVAGLFRDLLAPILQGFAPAVPLAELLFAAEGLRPRGAIAVCAATLALAAVWAHRREAIAAWMTGLPPAGRRGLRAGMVTAGILGLLVLPQASGAFLSHVVVLVGLYTLMGFGLNLEVGLAGLLDLGFVAFFAIGAYTVGLLTSASPYAIAHLSFWHALPVAVIVSVIAGVFLGLPVLGIRGDYLAIATLGFGEITRLLVLSDFLRPWLGGAQGILQIPKPVFAGVELARPEQLFYLTLVASAAAAWVAWRLQDSRLGRAWMAIREDEDVAEAMGINLVNVKLLAYGLGAAFAGLSGAIFAVMVGSVFPHSFQMLISFNVLALIIVGGMGSLPGVVVGSLVLVGLPELLREFAEFRLLVYGMLLVAMMLHRPKGLWPARGPERELLAAMPQRGGASRATPAEVPVTVGPGGRGHPVTLLRCTGVTKRFGGLIAVNRLDLDVPPHVIHSVIGPNGAGKTTLFNCVTGFYTPDEGQIVFGGEPISGLRPDAIARRGIARTYQNIRLFGTMTALENVLVGMHIHLKSSWVGAICNTSFTRRDEATGRADAFRLLELVGLGPRWNFPARSLPYGEQRRLEIARALALRPRLLLLDEPTAGMNPVEALEMMTLIRRLRDELGITILLIEHNMRVVMGISERITVLDYGQKIAEGVPQEVREDPRVIEAYLGKPRMAISASTP